MTTNEAMMAISDKLSKIKQRAASLSQKTDHLNATIEHIEKELLGSGVEFWWINGPVLDVRMFNERDDDGNEVTERLSAVLGYAKVNGEWRIAVQDQRHEWEGASTGWVLLNSEDPVPLVRASRSIRIAAAEHLEAFLDAFDDAIANMEAKVDKANKLAADDLTQGRVDEASPEDMDRLWRALKTAGDRVELTRHVGQGSASSEVTRESSQAAAQRNAQGSRVARIINSKGLRFECGVSSKQAQELLDGGAAERK